MTPTAHAAAYRIIDANLNRTAEGLRVIEDLMRFAFERPELCERLRNLRHRVRRADATVFDRGIEARDAVSDPGLAVSQKSRIDDRADTAAVLTGNFKRIQEGLRSLEEQFKAIGRYEAAKTFETARYESYTLEKDAAAAMFAARRRAILDTDIYALTSEPHSRGRSNMEVVRAMVDAGIQLIQYREKEKSTGEKFRECREIRQMTRDAGVRFIVNDDPALAVMADADGLHLGQDDYPIAEVRKLVGEAMAIGLSTHSPDQAAAACRAGVDYIGVGPIFKTFTKKDVCDPVGFSYLDHVVAHIDLPFVAIGGIKAHNLDEVVGRGANCVAMVTEIVGAEDIRQMVGQLKTIIKHAKESRS